jgi:hypothetical protein
MTFKEWLLTIFQCFNPDSYKDLIHRNIVHAIAYFFFVLAASFIVMTLLFIPAISRFNSVVDKRFSGIDGNINISYNIHEPFVFIQSPLVRFDNSANFTDERFLVTDDSIIYKRFILFGSPKIQDITTDYEIKSLASTKLLIILLPSIILWSFIILLAYFSIIILFTFILGMIIAAVFRLPLTWMTILKSAIYASTILILLQNILMPLYALFLIPLIAYWIMFMLVLLLLREETLPHGSEKIVFKDHSSSKNIFKSRNENYTDNDDAPIRKKKRSFDDENEGYIMLK